MSLITRLPVETPPKYPRHLEQVLRPRHGPPLWMRPIVPSDAAALAAEFARADDDTVYMRFLSPAFDLTADRLRYLTEIDYSSHLALVLMTDVPHDPDGVAIARYAARSDSEVEGAIVVKPEFRNRGIGRLLIEQLKLAAAAAGYATMSASYLAENDAAGGLMASCGFEPPQITDGVAETRLRLVEDPAAMRSV